MEYRFVRSGVSLFLAASILVVLAACVGPAADGEAETGVTRWSVTKAEDPDANGSSDFCNDPSAPCVEGEGDCDNNDQCDGDLICVADVGADWGMLPGYDVCMSPCPPDSENGTASFCSPECPCSHGQGDCDRHADCEEGLSCVADVGADWGMLPGYDVCLNSCPPDSENGTASFCSPECPCGEGEGDCDRHADCEEGLVCVADVGADWGMLPGYDVCEYPCPPDSENGTASFCSPECPCSHGQGDCDRHADCEEGLSCVADVGADWGMLPGYDVCLSSCPPDSENGTASFCSVDCPCSHGEGDCDRHADCESGLTCGINNGAVFGMLAGYDVCWTCENGVQDGDEDGVDCGGDACTPCGLCPADMLRIGSTDVCIDRYEASEGAGGAAASTAGAFPWAEVTYSDAAAACAAAGKRLCTLSEWQAACVGPDDLRYPYGEFYDAWTCNGGDYGEGSTTRTGSLTDCEGGYEGLFDMSGNVWEWVSGCSGGDCTASGGSYYDIFGSQLDCDSTTTRDATSEVRNIGFRCCRDL